jgi:uncharacterized damage-inducible protein DinB
MIDYTLLNTHAAYHYWRSRTWGCFLRTLDPVLFSAPVSGVLPSLTAIVTHIHWADLVWFARIHSLPPEDSAIPPSYATAEELTRRWESHTRELRDWLQQTPPDAWPREITYTTTTGQTFSNSLPDIILHIVDHASYHTGQLAMALRQVAPNLRPPSTNFIHYLRDRDSN